MDLFKIENKGLTSDADKPKKGFLLQKKTTQSVKNIESTYFIHPIEIVWINFMRCIALKEHQYAIKYQFTDFGVAKNIIRKLFPPLYSHTTTSNWIFFESSNV